MSAPVSCEPENLGLPWLIGLLDVTDDCYIDVLTWGNYIRHNSSVTKQWKLRRLSYCTRKVRVEDEREFLLLEFISTPDLPTVKVCVEHWTSAPCFGNGEVLLYGDPPALPYGVPYNRVPRDMVYYFIPGSKQEKRFETAHQPCQILSTWEYMEGIEAPSALQMSLLLNLASTTNKTPQRRLFLYVITGCLSNSFPASAVEGSTPRVNPLWIKEAVHGWGMAMVNVRGQGISYSSFH